MDHDIKSKAKQPEPKIVPPAQSDDQNLLKKRDLPLISSEKRTITSGTSSKPEEQKPLLPAQRIVGLLWFFMYWFGLIALCNYIGGRDGSLLEASFWLTASVLYLTPVLARKKTKQSQERSMKELLSIPLAMLVSTIFFWLLLRSMVPATLTLRNLMDIKDMSFVFFLLAAMFDIFRHARETGRLKALEDTKL